MQYNSEVTKLAALSLAQTTQLAHLVENFFTVSTSTVTDRDAAEKAVADLVSLDLEPGYKVTWVRNPRDGVDLMESMPVTYKSMSIYPREHLWNSIYNYAQQSLDFVVLSILDKMVLGTLHSKMYNNGKFQLAAQLCGRGHVHDCLSSPGYIARYKAYELLGARYAPKTAERLNGSVGVLKSAFALWVLPGQVVLCDKPTQVTIENDHVVSMTFAD